MDLVDFLLSCWANTTLAILLFRTANIINLAGTHFIDLDISGENLSAIVTHSTYFVHKLPQK